MKNTFIIIIVCLISFLNLSAQETKKDTLFFKYDENYLKTYKEIPNHIYLEDSSGIGNGNFFFDEIDIVNNIPLNKKTKCLKKYVHSSIYYNKNNKRALNDYRLWEHLNNYDIFLIKKNKGKIEFLKVRANFEIE